MNILSTESRKIDSTRENPSGNGAEKRLTPIKAIRSYCLECVCGSVYEVKICPSDNCPLYPYRLGKNPYAHKELTNDQRAELADRMRELRGRQ